MKSAQLATAKGNPRGQAPGGSSMAVAVGRYSKFGALPRSSKRLHQRLEADRPPYSRQDDERTFHKLQRRLGDDVLLALGERYSGGESATVLASEAGIAESALYAHLARLGVPRKRRLLHDDALPEMMRLRDQGWTYRAIGERFGVTRSAISSRLRAEPIAKDCL